MSKDITKKELFERIVELNTKVDLMSQTNKTTRMMFVRLVIFLAAFEILNTILNVILLVEHYKFMQP